MPRNIKCTTIKYSQTCFCTCQVQKFKDYAQTEACNNQSCATPGTTRALDTKHHQLQVMYTEYVAYNLETYEQNNNVLQHRCLKERVLDERSSRLFSREVHFLDTSSLQEGANGGVV